MLANVAGTVVIFGKMHGMVNLKRNWRATFWVAFCLSASGLSWAASGSTADTVYVCVGPDGRKVYQNYAGDAGCRRIDGLQLSVPSPDARRHLPDINLNATHAAVGHPGQFPRVDASTQRLRDSDRRQILTDELQSEEARLRDLRARFNQGHPNATLAEPAGSPAYLSLVQKLSDDIERAEGNIASLRRELTQAKE
jgi:hypothetical protein